MGEIGRETGVGERERPGRKRRSDRGERETSTGAKSSFSRPALVKVVDQLELFMLIFSSKESQLTSCALIIFLRRIMHINITML